jgi:hypothetical protein
VAGVTADTPATVLCDGDAGLWRLQREALPNATIVLDWWHVAVRFEHALQSGSQTGAGKMALVAWALVGMPAQTRGAMPLGAAYSYSWHSRHRAPGKAVCPGGSTTERNHRKPAEPASNPLDFLWCLNAYACSATARTD